MKQLLYLFLLLFQFCFATAQDYQYTQTDETGLGAPDSKSTTTKDVAAYINKYCKSDEQKVRAIYVWIISHITYSTDSGQFVVTDEDREKLVAAGMRRRKGLCENFAAIFDDICKKAGLHSFAIEGYTQHKNGDDNTSHAWNAAMINNEWFLFDPTWDAVQPGLSSPVKTSYFMRSPAEFIQNHMPFDPMLQFLDHPVTFKDFNNGAIEAKNKDTYFNYKDSIDKYKQDDPYHQYLGAYNRILQNGTPNEMTKTKLSQLRLELEIIYQDKDSVLYNTAVNGYNTAVKLFNDFVAYRNNQFKPAKTNGEVQTMFTDIKNYLSHAINLLKEVNASSANLILDTGDMEYAIKKLTDHVAEQEDFYKAYSATSIAK